MPPTRDLLLKAKCKALVRARWGDVVDGAVDATLPGGAVLSTGGTVWVLAEDDPQRSLGAALACATKRAEPGAPVHLMATGAGGLLARRAALFAREITVWPIEGTALGAAPSEAERLDPEPPLDPLVEPFRLLFERAGAEAVLERGLLRAEVRGLEVGRVVMGPDGPKLAVGVGKHDREAQQEVRGDRQGFDELFEVVRIVAEHRVPGGEGHAAYHLASERWLRSVVVRRPDLVGAEALHVVPSPIVREDLRHAAPAPAAGVTAAGDPILVVCSVGFDLDLVPASADAWLVDGRRPRLVFCLPEGDDLQATRDLAGELSVDTAVVTVPRDWRAL
jgi:hypothetical protein